MGCLAPHRPLEHSSRSKAAIEDVGSSIIWLTGHCHSMALHDAVRLLIRLFEGWTNSSITQLPSMQSCLQPPIPRFLQCDRIISPSLQTFPLRHCPTQFRG